MVADGDDMLKANHRTVHICRCPECLEQPTGEAAQFHASINCLVARLDEKHRRQFVGLLASQLGRGGIASLTEVTGLNRKTISRGRRELEPANVDGDGQIRAPGGGRQPWEKKSRGC